jgi:hypothetical protein
VLTPTCAVVSIAAPELSSYPDAYIRPFAVEAEAVHVVEPLFNDVAVHFTELLLSDVVELSIRLADAAEAARPHTATITEKRIRNAP